jgi:hypothetical protein
LLASLVAVVFYLTRKEDTIRQKEVETLNELMQTGVLNKDNFCMLLQDLVHNRMIDENSSEKLGKLLEDSFNEGEDS